MAKASAARAWTAGEIETEQDLAEQDMESAISGKSGKPGKSNARILAEELLQEAEETEQANHRIQTGGLTGLWTVEDMSEDKPIKADLHGDGTWPFAFRPSVFATSAARKRFRRGDEYSANPTPAAYDELLDGYDELLAWGLTEWPLYERVTDKQGKPVLDATTKEQKLEAWPITIDNVARLRNSDKIELFNVISAAMRGEANGQD